MPVCITGMHRSGTSLVANLLRLSGLYLGAEQDLMPASSDNQRGYWENRKFSKLNDEVLKELGGTWDLPPVTSKGWAEQIYEIYFRAARSELRRVLEFLDLPVSEELIERSVAAISDELRHQQFREEMAAEAVDPGVANLYQALCREADYNYSASQNN